jgi:Tfp pilus assembly protein PilF
VRYVLEGSVQRSNDRLRINAQLIDALTGGHVWADRIDGSLEDVFSLQDNVTRTVADALAQKLGAPATQATNPAETQVPAAYDELLRGMEHFHRTTPEDYAAAIPLFEHAIKLDPNYGRAYAALALLYLRIRDRDYGPTLGITPADAWAKAKGYLAEAQKHPTAGSHQVTGYILLDTTSPEAAVAEFQQAIALDPSDSWNHVFLGTALANGGWATQGENQIQTAMRLDPHYPPIFGYHLALAQFAQEHFDQAASSLEEVLKSNPDDHLSLLLLTAAYGYLGKTQEAKSSFDRHNKVMVGRGYIPTSVQTAAWMTYPAVNAHDRLVKGLRLAGAPEYLLAGDFAARNHLKAEEIRKLAFGHRLHGRDWAGFAGAGGTRAMWTTGAEYDAVISPNGSITMTGPWGSVWNAATSFDGDKFCYITPTGGEICGDIFRNPGGTRIFMNEMMWSIRSQIFTFSVID